MFEIIFFAGLSVFAVGGLGILIAAFSTSVFWGIGCLLIPPVSIVYLFIHWADAKNPFLLQLFGASIMVIGAAMKGSV